jgi:hypothetical protein
MNFQKIVGLAAIALAIVGAFFVIPYLAAMLVILGLVAGLAIDAPDHVRVIVSAIALNTLSSALTSIPAIGDALANMLSNFGIATAGAALMVILRNIYVRFKP